MYQEFLSKGGFSLERLASFCAVADKGSITAAAGGDPSRQALISRQIRELETFFGGELVRRRGRGLELTELGKELAAVGRDKFKSLADFLARAQSAEWTLRLAVSNSVAQWLLLPCLNRLHVSTSKDLRFEISHEQTAVMVNGVREGIFDLAFVRADSLDEGFERHLLGTVKYGLFVPRSLLPTKSAKLKEILNQVPLALPIGGSLRESVERMASGATPPMRPKVECSSYLQAAQLVRSGFCAAVLPIFAKGDAFAELGGNVKIFEIDFRYDLVMAWTRRSVQTRPRLEQLIGEFSRVLKF